MKYYSTNRKSSNVSLSEALFRGLADDGGLFMPEEIPQMPQKFFKNIKQMSFQEISFEVAKELFRDEISENDLEEMVYDAFKFEVPIVQLDEKVSVLELTHGPTLSFKDFLNSCKLDSFLSFLVLVFLSCFWSVNPFCDLSAVLCKLSFIIMNTTIAKIQINIDREAYINFNL